MADTLTPAEVASSMERVSLSGRGKKGNALISTHNGAIRDAGKTVCGGEIKIG